MEGVNISRRMMKRAVTTRQPFGFLRSGWYGFRTQKGRQNCRPFDSPFILLPSDEPFNVLLRTNATNRRSSNGLHGETSISLASPPSFNPILNLLSPPCQEKTKRRSSISSLPPFCTMPSEYHECPHRSEDGAPSPERLRELGLLK